MDNILILIRGVGGAGKTTFANFIDCPVCSTDDYFLNSETGSYDFQPRKLSDAHLQCLTKTENLMRLNLKKIAVANTFILERDLEPYTELAKTYNYSVFSIIVENRHGNKNIHGVAEKTLQKMASNLQIKLL